MVLPILSFSLLIVGPILDHTGQGWFSPTVKLVWYLAAFLPVGLPVIREAYHEALRKDFFTEFTLMSVASTGAFSIGEYPEAVAVMLFYTVGEKLQNRAVERASQNINRLLDVRPERTDVFREGNYINVSPKEVRTGERIEVKPGGRIPLDGILQETEVSFDTSALTGESMPRTLRKGDEVLAGMIVLGQAVRIEVNRPYEQSALARILVLVKDAAERKAPAELFIRRFARFYTPAVIVLALLIVTVPAFAGLMMPSFQYVFHDWLYRGLVFLVISCTCALVISVPLGYFGGILLIIPIHFLVLKADLPQRTGIDRFYQMRCTKRTWIFGQAVFAAAESCFELLFLLVSSCVLMIGTGRRRLSFSDAVTHLTSVYPDRTGDYVVQLLPGNLYQQMTLEQALIHTFCLLLLYFMLISYVLLFSAVSNHRYVGILVNGFAIILGAVTCEVRMKQMWILPMAHTIPWLHYDEYLDRMNFPMWGSYLYLGAISALLLVLCFARAGHYQVKE